MKHNDRPATFGGRRFQYRDVNWKSDLGSLWQNWCIVSDGAPLKEVLLAQPGDVYSDIHDIDAKLLLEKPSFEKLRSEYLQLAETYEKLGITVHRCEHPQATPNWIFQRDLYNSTPNGIVLGRPASRERRGEERLMQEILAQKHAPIIGSIHKDALFEGADLLWITPKKALFGIGNRSNAKALEQLQHLYPETEFFSLTLPEHIQHLLGLVNFIAPYKVGIWTSQCSAKNRSILERAGLEIVEILAEKEIRNQRSFNWVCIAPNRLLLPKDAPKTISHLRTQGIEIATAAIAAYRQCGGGLGCVTGILNRR
ncbi:MAG: arginine deiminase family protein [Myxococcota bacterium]|nr:arginine deiminase family protein [Myxococcota bacterium]